MGYRVMKKCSVKGCRRDHAAKGFCGTHYRRWRVDGKIGGEILKKDRAISFLKDLLRSEQKTCAIWPFNTDKDGYGKIIFDGKHWRAHRLILHLAGRLNAPVVRHSCHNPGCVNPAHLIAGSAKQNSEDAVQAGRMQSGEDRPASKLTQKEAVEIRTAAGKESQRSIAKRYGVSQTTISSIVRHETWRTAP